MNWFFHFKQNNNSVMKFRIRHNRLFPRFNIYFRESYFKSLASIEIYLFRVGFGVLFHKKVSKTSKHVTDLME